MNEPSVTKTFRVRRDRHGQKRLRAGAETQQERIPRIARLMALAIRFDELIRSGVVADQAELARRGSVSRARITQIMDLMCLAPQIQEELLNLRVDGSMKQITERSLRVIAKNDNWNEQLAVWQHRQTLIKR